MRGTVVRGIRPIVSAAAVTLLLTACENSAPEAGRLTADPDPPTRSADSRKATSSGSPDPTVTSVNQIPGVEFVRRYIHLVNRARETGEVAPVRAASGPDCRSCAGVMDLISEVHRSGGRFDGDPNWHLKGISADPGRTDKHVILAYIEIAKHKVVREAGAKAEPGKSGFFAYKFTVERQGNGWIVTRLIDTT